MYYEQPITASERRAKAGFLRYFKDPRVTNDRQPPKWFMDELEKIDPLLKVEWWNYHHTKGPSFRLIRVLPDGRFTAIDRFQYEDEMRLLLKWLRANDTHSRGYSQMQAYNELIEAQRREVREERERIAAIEDEAGEELVEEYFKAKDTMYSIPGVNSRRNWNNED